VITLEKKPPLEALPFTDGTAAFEYWCKYGDVDIKEKTAVPALILDRI
jgi:hypothetical protein